MRLSDIINESCIRVGGTPFSKEEALREIAALACECGGIEGCSESELFEALRRREKIGSTGFGRGIAIPHCGLEKIDRFVTGILIVPGGVDFDALDGKPVRVLFFIIGPASMRNRHIQILSSVSKLLSDEHTVQRLADAGNKKTIMGIITEMSGQAGGIERKKEKNLFHVFVQREECFDDILQVFSASAGGSISVIEVQNAGYYLNALPLFASFWSDQAGRFCRIIVAVVDRDLSNDVIRRVHTAVGDIENAPGVLIAVQDLAYSAGSMEY